MPSKYGFETNDDRERERRERERKAKEEQLRKQEEEREQRKQWQEAHNQAVSFATQIDRLVRDVLLDFARANGISETSIVVDLRPEEYKHPAWIIAGIHIRAYAYASDKLLQVEDEQASFPWNQLRKLASTLHEQCKVPVHLSEPGQETGYSTMGGWNRTGYSPGRSETFDD